MRRAAGSAPSAIWHASSDSIWSWTSIFPTRKRHVLLFGPIGSGKSTELLRLDDTLKKGKRLLPILLNVRSEIDINNLQYADVLMAMAMAVVRELEKQGLDIPAAKLRALEQWFAEQVRTDDKINELMASITNEAGAEFGIPFLAKLTARLTAAFKTSSVTPASCSGCCAWRAS